MLLGFTINTSKIKSVSFPYRVSNPGRLGENQES